MPSDSSTDSNPQSFKKYIWKFLSDIKAETKEDALEFIRNSRPIYKNKNDNEEIINPDLKPHEYINEDEHFKNLIENNVLPAVHEILNAINDNLPIIVHGDYDVDGQTATAILWRTIFNDLNYKNVFPYIPNRFDEGYGLSKDSIKGMKDLMSEKGFVDSKILLITVDCGITSIKEVEQAKAENFITIITDHHHGSDVLPDADYLVWTEKATGAGIAWLISYILRKEKNITDEQNSKYLDLAAMGTVCDLQPLTGYNRSIAKYGIQKINESPILGIQSLVKLLSLKNEIETYHLGWSIGPQLNASGRLETAMDSLRILCSESVEQTDKIAQDLNVLNKQRQELTINCTNSAIKELEERFDGVANIPNQKFLIAQSTNFHEGVIGLVAGKITQRFYRPSMAIAIDKETGIGKGSARSIEGVSIIESLQKFADLFEKFGGHDMAAGFSIKQENIEKLFEGLNNLDEWDEEIFIPKLKIDLEANPEILDQDFYTNLQNLQPFGNGNPEPTFAAKDLEILNESRMGSENKHMKLFLKAPSGKQLTALLFNADYKIKFNIGDQIDAVFNLSANTWNGKTNIEWILKDIDQRYIS